MGQVIQNNFRVRKHFGRINKIIDIPNLIDIQKRSYDKLLQAEVAPDRREEIGLQGVFNSVFPIKDFSETSSLEFVSYNLERPKYDVDATADELRTIMKTLEIKDYRIIRPRRDNDAGINYGVWVEFRKP